MSFIREHAFRPLSPRTVRADPQFRSYEALPRYYRTKSTAKLRKILNIHGDKGLQKAARRHAYNELVRRRGER